MNVTLKVVETSKSKHKNILKKKIEDNVAIVGVIGMGYVGLPNMVSKAKKGNPVIGFDINRDRIDMVNNGKSYIDDVSSFELNSLIKNSQLMATDDFTFIEHTDVILICVPTPLDKHKQPNLDYVNQAVKEIAENILPGTLVILESTTFPSTTKNIVAKQLEEKGFTIGEDVFVAYSPERIDPSNKVYNVDNTPRIVGGQTKKCAKIAKTFIGRHSTIVSSTEVAELTKVYENTFRHVNIALANELALLCDKMDVNVWEVIEAAKTKPYGFMPFYPTTKIGGHCIPVDPYYLSWYSKKYGLDTQLINSSSEINSRMLDYTIGRIVGILNEQGMSVSNSKIALLGASYKKNTRDTRESSVYNVYKKLDDMGSHITVYDPHVDRININEKEINVDRVIYKGLLRYDLVVLLTDHCDFDYEKIVRFSKSIFDTRGVIREKKLETDKYYTL